MTFTIFPAIDLRGGQCVRLSQGDYNQETVYGYAPLAMAHSFVEQGATFIHTVDLDGAKVGARVNDAHVIQIANELNVDVQIGGGIRTEADVDYYLSNGVRRVILGSSAIRDPQFVKRMLKVYGERIVLGLDARDGFVSIDGWLETSSVRAIDLAVELVEHGAETFIFTDIATDGMLSGPNIAATVALAEATNKAVIASGGVASLADVIALKQTGVLAGSIVGKAIYSGKFTVREAVQL